MSTRVASGSRVQGAARGLPTAARKIATKVSRVGVSPAARAEIRRLVAQDAVTRTSAAEVAKRIEPLIKVNWPQAETARRLRLDLEAAGIPERQISRKVAAYERKAVKRRSRLIAECELSQVRQDRWRAEQETEAGPDGSLEWATTKSVRHPKSKAAAKRTGPCWICRQMAGVRVRVGGTFLLPNGKRVRGPLAHPSCHCWTFAVESSR